MLERRGLAAIDVPTRDLHEEYSDGQYVILRVCKL